MTLAAPRSTSTGRKARSPAAIPLRGWRQILTRLRKEIAEDHVSVVAAGIAFYGLIALFPAIAALVGLSGFFLDPSDLGSELTRLASRLPPSAASIIEGQVFAVTGGSGAGSGLVALSGLAVAVYGAMKGVMTLIEGLNIAYDETEDRGFFRLYLTALILTLAILVGFLATLALAIILPSILQFLPLGGVIEAVLPWASWLILALFTMLGLAFIYRFGPSRRPARWRWVSPGACLATLVWIAGTIGFSVYVQNLGTYAETYGALGGVIILLTWLWLSAFVVLAGAELNAEIEQQAGRDPASENSAPDKSAPQTDSTPEPRHAFFSPPTPGKAGRTAPETQERPALVPLIALGGLVLWHALSRKDGGAPR
ncbi:YihY/virulence factor BrkB family protein [Paracoccus ravus]|uniref:YihY/virulence factor BrkB family protein n=1 Tax=Paracoccus ravus TaxID=2447760 RepID=UPI00106EEFFB|nr:YihY/virulence factor BrkB family protein [Paracoccus ravus]